MIEKILDKHLKKKQGKPRKRSGKYSPSSFGRCYRNQYWNRKDEKPSNPIDSRTLRVFAVGNIFHEFIEKLFKDTEVLIELDDIKGFADIVTDDSVIDIKTVHSQKFWYLKKESKIPITTRERCNFLQVCFYALALKKPKATICMVSKDDLCIAEYTIQTDVLKKEVNEEIATLRKIWEDDKLPKAEPRAYPQYRTNKKTKEMELVGFKECDYCQFRDMCKALEDNERN